MSISFSLYAPLPILPFTTSRHYGDCKVQCNSIHIDTICLFVHWNWFDGILSAFCVLCFALVDLPMNRIKPIGHPNTNTTFWLQIGPQSKTKLNDEFRFNPFSGFQLLKCLFFIRIIFHLFFLFFFWNL